MRDSHNSREHVLALINVSVSPLLISKERQDK
jgi:hypothetical protein